MICLTHGEKVSATCIGASTRKKACFHAERRGPKVQDSQRLQDKTGWRNMGRE